LSKDQARLNHALAALTAYFAAPPVPGIATVTFAAPIPVDIMIGAMQPLAALGW
jgi:hypothetical protein